MSKVFDAPDTVYELKGGKKSASSLSMDTGARKIGISASATLTSNLIVIEVMSFHTRNIPTSRKLCSYTVSPC